MKEIMTLCNEKIILFGACELSENIYHVLNEKGLDVVFFLDNNKEGVFTKDNVPIRKPDEWLKLDDYMIIVSIMNYQYSVINQLEEYGYKSGLNLFFYREFEELNVEGLRWYYQGRLLKDYYVDGKYLPKILMTDLSSYCNARCVYCGNHSPILNDMSCARNYNMPEDTWKKIVEYIKMTPSIRRVHNVMSGEMLMHPNWEKYLYHLAENTNIDTFYFSTNGILLTKDNIDRLLKIPFKSLEISVSIDGLTPEENDRYRLGTSYQKIKESLYYLLSIRPDFPLRIQNCHFLTMEEVNNIKYSASEVSDFPEYIKNDFKMYPQIAFVTVPTFGYNEKLAEYFKDHHVHRELIENINDGMCELLFSTISINSKGEYVPCGCGNFRNEYIQHNVNNMNILEFFNSDFMKEARECFLNGTYPDACRNCYSAQDGNNASIWVYD